MPRLTEDELQRRDAERDLNAELLDAIDDLKAGRIGRVTIVHGDQVVESPVARARLATKIDIRSPRSGISPLLAGELDLSAPAAITTSPASARTCVRQLTDDPMCMPRPT